MIWILITAVTWARHISDHTININPLQGYSSNVASSSVRRPKVSNLMWKKCCKCCLSKILGHYFSLNIHIVLVSWGGDILEISFQQHTTSSELLNISKPATQQKVATKAEVGIRTWWFTSNCNWCFAETGKFTASVKQPSIHHSALYLLVHTDYLMFTLFQAPVQGWHVCGWSA